MDRATRLRMAYAEMLLRSYGRRMQDAPGVVAAFEAKLRQPRLAQEETLRRILERNAGTEYGRRHGFDAISGYDAYRRRVPVVSHEELRPLIDRMLAGEADVLVAGKPSYYSVTSGSTAAPKTIPGTQASIVAGCEALTARNAYLRRDHPAAFAGRALYVVGSVTEGEAAGGVAVGAMTGFGYFASQIGFPGRQFPYALFTIPDYAARYRAILRLALAARDLSALAVYNPSTLLLLIDIARRDWDELVEEIGSGGLDADLPPALRAELAPELAADPGRAAELSGLRDAGLRAWWPELAVVSCWKGGSLGFYLEELRPRLGGLPVRDLGILASEALVSIPIDDRTAGGVLLPEAAFFEFVPEDGGGPLAAWQLAAGGSYRVIVTTHGGLYRYDLADVVRVEGFHLGMPVLSFQHRAGRVYSFTGEKLTEVQVTLAVRRAADGARLRLAGFTAVPAWGRPPRYELRAEAAPGIAGHRRWRRFARLLDEALREVNVEYAGKRSSGRLAPAGLVLVAPGTFESQRRRGASREAQYKETHLAPDPSFGSEWEVVARIA